MSVMVSTHQSCACIGYKTDRKGTIIPSAHFEICYVISFFDHTIWWVDDTFRNLIRVMFEVPDCLNTLVRRKCFPV